MANFAPRQYGKVLHELTAGLKGQELSEAITEFVRYLIREQVFTKAEQIIAAYLDYVEELDGVEKIEIMSARELSKSEILNIAKSFGEKVEAKNIVDQQLIGGVRIKKNDIIYDASLKTQLNQLKSILS